MSAHAKVASRMSVEEFLAWEPGGFRWQLVDGEPRAMSPPTRGHGALQAELCRVIGNHLDRISSPCAVIAGPGVIPHVQAGFNFRIPDLAVSCADVRTEQAALTTPVLIVEILSASNHAETWANVWAYTTIPSVREILVLRSLSIGADLLRRQADDTWPREPVGYTNGDLVLESIGLRTAMEDLYRNTPLRSSG